jgi:hypothetical protein
MGALRMLLRNKNPINSKCEISLQSESTSACARNNDFIEELHNNFSLKLKH